MSLTKFKRIYKQPLVNNITGSIRVRFKNKQLKQTNWTIHHHNKGARNDG